MLGATRLERNIQTEDVADGPQRLHQVLRQRRVGDRFKEHEHLKQSDGVKTKLVHEERVFVERLIEIETSTEVLDEVGQVRRRIIAG